MSTNSSNDIALLLRRKAINREKKTILITNFKGSSQEGDLTVPPNCNGYGRIRHFNLDAGDEWIHNTLPILPAAKALKTSFQDQIKAQVFQSSICNWNCWYCFVDNMLLCGNTKYASDLTCDDLVDLYLKENDPAPMLDLTGGQPDLTPEWIPWMMQTLKDRGLEKKIFLWSDDNLSCDFFWQFLNESQIEMVYSYPMYSRVCCFKGIDKESFSLNTKANPCLFENQFELCQRLLNINIDLYCYITLTASTNTNFEAVIPTLFDKIQKIDELLPLRILPLRIFQYSPLSKRLNKSYQDMLEGQIKALPFWIKELKKRFSSDLLALPITDVKLKKHKL